MIDISTEKLISLEDASALFPGRDGATVHVQTLKLYSTRGKKGIVLETVLAGPRRCTSVQAVQRFIECLSATPPGRSGVLKAITVARSRRELAKAAREASAALKASGA